MEDNLICESLNKPSAVIAMSMNKSLTLTQYKNYNALLFFAKKSLRKNPTDYKFSIKLSDLKTLSGDKTTQNRRTREALDELAHIDCEYNVLGKDGEVKEENRFMLLAGITVKHGTGTVEYSFPHQVMDMLINNMYAQIDMGAIRDFKSKYSIKLYELCKDYENAPTIPVIDILKFKKIFNCELYSHISHLKDFVLNPAVNEINGNKYIPFLVSYELNKNGKECRSVKFAINNKGQYADKRTVADGNVESANLKKDSASGDLPKEKPPLTQSKIKNTAEPSLFDLENDIVKNKFSKINFNFKTRDWENITVEDKKVWEEAYPACDIDMEFLKMKAWLLANPDKRKYNYKRFINNWLSKQQDKGGTNKLDHSSVYRKTLGPRPAVMVNSINDKFYENIPHRVINVDTGEEYVS